VAVLIASNNSREGFNEQIAGSRERHQGPNGVWGQKGWKCLTQNALSPPEDNAGEGDLQRSKTGGFGGGNEA